MAEGWSRFKNVKAAPATPAEHRRLDTGPLAAMATCSIDPRVALR